MTGDGQVDRRFVQLADPDGSTVWRLDAGFLTSGWECIWGRGCQGIHDERRPELVDGCCSVGVVIQDDDEAMTIAALAATLPSTGFQYAGERDSGGVLHRSGPRWSTRVVDGACIFLNRPGFPGGAGCALHRAAVEAGEPPVDWKPTTCTRLPLRVEEERVPDGGVVVTVRAWRRDDWGPGGSSMAWWCTEAPEAFLAETPLCDRAADELADLMGSDLADRARALLTATPGSDGSGRPGTDEPAR